MNLKVPVHWGDEPQTNPPARAGRLAGSSSQDAGNLVRPMLEALRTVTGLDCTYLTVFDWDAHEQEVRFAFCVGTPVIEEGIRLALPPGLTPEAFPGVTRSPSPPGAAEPDSWIARGLGFETYLSVPVTLARHRLYGMLCGASAEPRLLDESVISLFESFADTIAAYLVRDRAAAAEARAAFAERQLAERASFLAEAGHRLKTPLTVLQGTAYLLREHRDDLSEAKRSQLNDSLLGGVQWLSSEIEAMLSEARSEVFARELTRVEVPLPKLVREITTAFDGLRTGHRVVMEAPAHVVVLGDAVAIRQILGHLLDNAIKHGPPGGRVLVRVGEGEDAITIDVIDDGAGPPVGVDVFDPFRHTDGADDRRIPIRLGLHIVRKLAEAMGGSVDVIRRSDNTSTFRVTLPSAPARRR